VGCLFVGGGGAPPNGGVGEPPQPFDILRYILLISRSAQVVFIYIYIFFYIYIYIYIYIYERESTEMSIMF
jgi:hypothetical protein